MASNGTIEGAESPFLLEALESPSVTQDEQLRWARMRPLAAAMTASARRHLERALVRDAVDRGVRDRRKLAEAVASLRHTMDPRRRSEATVERDVDVAEAEVVTPFLTEELEVVRDRTVGSRSSRPPPPRPPRLDPSALAAELDDEEEYDDGETIQAEAEDDELDEELHEAAWPDEGESPFLEGEAGSPLDALSPSELKAVRITSTFETGRAGSFGGLTGNFDGQGISFGLLNFAWKAGSLITVLKDFIKNHPTDFAEVFGSDADRFKDAVLATMPDPKHPKRRVRDVERQMVFARSVNNEKNKIQEPWRSYFGKLETNAAFRRIQVKAVRKAAEKARYWCDYFGLKTERGYAFMFDMVSSNGGAWLNAPKFKGRRRRVLREMLDKKKTEVGRDLTELEKLEVIAHMIGAVVQKRWRKGVRIRKLWFVTGRGKVHGDFYDLKKDFGVTDDPPDFGAGGGKQAKELVDSPSFELDDELEDDELEDDELDELEDDEAEDDEVEDREDDELESEDVEGEDESEIDDGEYEDVDEEEEGEAGGELEELEDDELEDDEAFEDSPYVTERAEPESSDEAFEIDQEIEAEADVQWEGETDAMLAADTVDADAAEPVFPAAVRTPGLPLLPAAKTTKAVAWNAARHPGLSGIGVDAISRRLGVYIDLSKLKQMMRDAGGYGSDDATLMALAAHQFQRRIYAQIKKRDGMVGEGTLDALGFVRHRGAKLNPWDKVNQTAKKRLVKVEKANPGLFAPLGSDVSAATWFKLIVNAPFLGQPFNTGIHVELLRRLRRGQAHLMTLSPYKGLTPAEIGVKLGIEETHKGARPSATTKSMHTFGLATDISYLKNPWVSGRSKSPVSNAEFKAVTGRASLLITGKRSPLTPKLLHWLGENSGLDTAGIWDRLQRRNEQLKGYLMLARDSSALRALLTTRKSTKTEEVFEPAGESLDAAVTRWTGIIADDVKKIAHSFGGKRDPMKGFLNLPRDLVVALRDHGCCAWGAVDLGENASGDMMHFDSRASGIGRLVRPDPAHHIVKGHPCVTGGAKESEIAFEHQLTATPTWKQHPTAAGALFGYKSAAANATTAVFVPSAVSPSSSSVDVLVYLHGLLVCGGEGSTAVSYVRSKGFPLVEQLEKSGRPVVLIAPSLRWTRGQGSHRLGSPSRMNALVDEVLAGLKNAGWSTAPSIGNLYLAGHSKAFVVLDALGEKVGDAASSRGALSKLCEVWSFDTMYRRNSACKVWLGWALQRSAVKFVVHFRPGTKTAHASECLENAIQARAGTATGKKGCGCTSSASGQVTNVTVVRHKGRHCPMVKVVFPTRLAAMSSCI